MGTSDEVVREILKDLDGLAMLNAWEATLLANVKEKAAALIEDSGRHPPTSKPPPHETGTDCAGDGGDSVV